MKPTFHINQPLDPAHPVGSRLGKLTVVAVIEHSARQKTKKQWWYLVECDCGAREELNQGHLQVRRDCRACMFQRKRENRAPPRKDLVPPHVPDFARIKLR